SLRPTENFDFSPPSTYRGIVIPPARRLGRRLHELAMMKTNLCHPPSTAPKLSESVRRNPRLLKVKDFLWLTSTPRLVPEPIGTNPNQIEPTKAQKLFYDISNCTRSDTGLRFLPPSAVRLLPPPQWFCYGGW